MYANKIWPLIKQRLKENTCFGDKILKKYCILYISRQENESCYKQKLNTEPINEKNKENKNKWCHMWKDAK